MTIKVDLLPTERRRFGFDPVIGFLLVIIAICAVAFWIYGTTLSANIEKQKALIVEKENKIKEMESKVPVIEELKKANRQLEAQISTVRSLVYDPVRYANLLQEITEVLPPNIWIANLSVEPSSTSIVFNGTAVDTPNARPLFSIATMMRNIQNSKYLMEPSLASANQTKVQNQIGYTFQIEARYSPDAAAGLKTKEGKEERK